MFCRGSNKARRYIKHAGIFPLLSGIMFEAAYIRNSVNEYLDFLKKNHFEYIEVSEGIIEIPPTEKAEHLMLFPEKSK